MCDDYEKDYLRTINSLYNKISGDFFTRIDEYSMLTRGLIENRESMEELGVYLQATVDELSERLKELNNMIWEETQTND